MVAKTFLPHVPPSIVLCLSCSTPVALYGCLAVMRVLMYVLFCHCHFNSERAGAETKEENNDEQNRTHRMKPKRDRDRSKERSEWKLSRRLIVDHFYAPKGAQRRTQTMLSSKAKKLSHYALFAFERRASGRSSRRW